MLLTGGIGSREGWKAAPACVGGYFLFYQPELFQIPLVLKKHKQKPAQRLTNRWVKCVLLEPLVEPVSKETEKSAENKKITTCFLKFKTDFCFGQTRCVENRWAFLADLAVTEWD